MATTTRPPITQRWWLIAPRDTAKSSLTVAPGLVATTTPLRIPPQLTPLWQLPVLARTTKVLDGVFLEGVESGSCRFVCMTGRTGATFTSQIAH